MATTLKYKVGTNSKEGKLEQLKNNKLTIQIDASRLYIFEKGFCTAILPFSERVTRGTPTHEYKRVFLEALNKFIKEKQMEKEERESMQEKKHDPEEERKLFERLAKEQRRWV